MSTTSSMQQTLQALLLSLKALDILSSDEKKRLRNIADRLAIKQDWQQEILPELLEIIKKSSQFQQYFVQAKRKLETLSVQEIQRLFPTVDELETVIPLPLNSQEKVAKPDGKPDPDGHHISNMVVRVLATDNPVKTVKKLFQEKEKNPKS